jgi:hypothetical protein
MRSPVPISATFALRRRRRIRARADARAGFPVPRGSRSTGSGEPGLVPVPAAIANAFFDATGLRIREAPMTPGRVRAVLAAAAT